MRPMHGSGRTVRCECTLGRRSLDRSFRLASGKTSCHTGWLKSAGMLLPLGYLIGNEYAEVIGDENDISSLRDTIHNYFSENSSIPDSGTPYYGYWGHSSASEEQET